MKQEFKNEHLQNDPFILYRGVVEDNNHPDKNGKVKVRIFGLHTENNENSNESFETISTSQLPWAEVSGDTSFGLVSGVGSSSVLKKGTWVWIILENNDVNKPIIFGVIKGKPKSKIDYATGKGFCDPDGVFPFDSRLGENDLNEIARGVINDTVINTKNTNLDTSPYYNESAQAASEYPYNDVIESESGHMIEIDDTPNAERVQIIDKNGNYSEMKLDEWIEKAVNHKINIVIGNLIEHVAGGVKQQVDLDFLRTITGYFEIKADGNLQIKNDVKIDGGLQTTGTITADSDITSKAEVADSQGNLSSLRDAYDAHYHIGNLGVPTGVPINTDPKTRTSDFTWTNTPKGFK